MSSLFGVELPTPVNFIIAFVFVLLLIGAAAWLVRRFGATRIDAAARGRQPRLAVIDSAAVDGRRKLVIIRRDNVEHLLMIGGPSDVVVETNIVRGAAVATRDAPAARNGGADDLPRAMPLPDPTPWPLQPEPAPTRRVADPPPARIDARRAHAVRRRLAAAGRARGPPLRPRPRFARCAPPTRSPASPPISPVRAEPAAARPAPAPAARAAAPGASRRRQRRSRRRPTDQSLAEMAQRLEAALRRPMAQKVVAETQRVTATVEVKAGTPKAAAQPRGGAQPPSRRAISNKRWQVF